MSQLEITEAPLGPFPFRGRWVIVGKSYDKVPLLWSAWASGISLFVALLCFIGGTEQPPRPLLGLAYLLFSLVTLVVAVHIRRKYLWEKRFDIPCLVMSRPQYRAGEEAELTFQRDFRDAGTRLKMLRRAGSLSLRLICVRKAKSGEDRRYLSYTGEWVEHPVRAGDVRLFTHWRVQIPPDIEGTQHAWDHSLIWQWEVRQRIPGQLDAITSFPVTIVGQ